jgi:hypothetical protein
LTLIDFALIIMAIKLSTSGSLPQVFWYRLSSKLGTERSRNVEEIGVKIPIKIPHVELTPLGGQPLKDGEFLPVRILLLRYFMIWLSFHFDLLGGYSSEKLQAGLQLSSPA